MLKQKRSIKMYVSLVVAILVLSGPPASEVRGDFNLWDDEELTVDFSPAGVGTLYDRSHVRVISGGSSSRIYAYDESTVTTAGGNVSRVEAYHTSSVDLSSGAISNLYVRDSAGVNMSGGSVYAEFHLSDSSAANISDGSIATLNTFDGADAVISGGSMHDLHAKHNSTVGISDVSMQKAYAYDSSRVNISGGSMDDIYAYDTSTVNIFDATLDDLTATGDSSIGLTGSSMDDVIAHGTMTISGCTVDRLFSRDDSVVEILDTSLGIFYAESRSTTTFIAREFRLGEGLTLDADRLLGTGRLSYESYDGTRYLTAIETNSSSATVLLSTGAATQITAPEMDLQDGPPLETATVGPGGDGEVGGLYGIWLRGDGVGGDSDYRWSISGGPEALPDTLLATLPDTDLDGSVDDYFLTFAHLAEAGARDRVATSPYTLRLEALDGGGLPIAGSESELLLLVPEPATLGILVVGGLAMVRRRKCGMCK